MELWLKCLLVYLLVINLIGFFSMGIDKRKAKKGSWRTKEKTLFLFAALGGSIGSMIGMKVFHHKTKKWYFKFGMPMILILQIALIFALLHFSKA